MATTILHQKTLMPSSWAMTRYGYTPEQRSSFWQFVQANGIPFVKLSARKILFDPDAVEAFEARRTVGKVAR